MTRERLAVAACSATFLLLVLFRGTTPIFPFAAGSHGVFFDEGSRVLDGEVMYRDFFEFVAPGTAYLTAVVQHLTGSTMAGVALAMVALGAALAVLVHTLTVLVVEGRGRLLAPALFVVLVYTPGPLGDHKWPALACGLLGLVVMGRDTAGAARCAWGGLLLGASAVFTQDLGLGLCGGTIGFLLSRRTRPRVLVLTVLSMAALPALVVGVFAWKAGLSTVIDDWLLYPLRRYPGMNVGVVVPALSLRTLPRELAQVAMAVASLATGVLALRAESPRDAGRLASDAASRLIAAAGLGVALIMAHRALFPVGLAVRSTVLLPLLARALVSGAPATGWSWLRGALALVLAAGLVHGAALAAWRQVFQPLTLEEHRAGRVWVPEPMPELTWIEQNTRPGEGTFLMPARGGQYFLTRTRNVTALPYLIEGQSTPEQARRALLEIETARPAVGLWDPRPWPVVPPGQAAPLALIHDGIRRSYDAERLPSGVLLLRRRAPVLSSLPR